ncbi:Predicted unusual protein kinase regulating ubiquinone biosynthesis, AarF/ABC1/UbiB family [Pseudoxanthobacter soli DSM 19599]|uniref:Predicted unusual protein kinase regulating ubiquinone biosynthesis, AarF/ABC1/UbiB family n=1 Tax=Pseudoxanthobacter soli DSM 19599 TaxID=1123029 RepID=A0A1M7ZRK6_9HYPH|nr:AarF/ABC1/UbiB kinase family protein [Pseudoxanthobacter soli]SHO67511.1 Predicted unusual protein kinase regulating ubiquinone biosynthesis, AarF/ABC1/UbiB family [Pseudoxanthobacter soli DSM 19599]
MADDRVDQERNRFTARAARYARVGTDISGVATRIMGARLLGRELDAEKTAADIAGALGGLKGPLMKVAQLLSTIPEAVPPEYAAALANLQSNAPPMGWAFVKRRMMAELGPAWEKRYRSFEKEPAAAASLGQVHRAVGLDGADLAVKLQYPDMESAVEADLKQFSALLAIHRRMRPAIDTREIAEEVGARLREELDYRREARHAALYRIILGEEPGIRVPAIVPELSTKRLLTMGWLEGRPMLAFKDRPLEDRNRLAETMFRAWWHPFARFGTIHGDPHLGNYTVFEEDGRPAGINLLDYGCIRIFPPRFVAGVIQLYRGLQAGNEDEVVAAYEVWGFRNLNRDLIETLNIWARFIYGPLLEDRVRPIAEGVSAAEYGRREAFTVAKRLKELGPVTVPREFVFMDRAALGLGGVFLHLEAELNFHRLFEAAIADFKPGLLAARQEAALQGVGLAEVPA